MSLRPIPSSASSRAHKRAVSVQAFRDERQTPTMRIRAAPTSRLSSSTIDITHLVEELIKGEKDSRKLHNFKTHFKYTQMTPLFESFCMVGTNGLESTEPQIICEYKNGQFSEATEAISKTHPGGIESFCFPKGITRTALKKKEKLAYQAFKKEQNEPKISPNRKPVSEPIDKFVLRIRSSHLRQENNFVFMLTNLDSVSYGICVYKDRVIMDGEFMEPFCFCLLSFVPFLDLHLSFLQFLFSHESIEGVLEKAVFDKVTKKPKFQDTDMFHLNEFLKNYQSNCFIPAPGKQFVWMFHPHPQYELIRPQRGEDETLFAAFGGTVLFDIVGSASVVKLISAVLLEKKVIIISKNLRTISAIVFSLLAIIRPFSWQSVVIPILPSALYDLLDAPVPILVGLTEMPQEHYDSDENNVYLDADNHILLCKKPFPLFPDSSKVADLLSSLFRSSNSRFHLPKFFGNDTNSPNVAQPFVPSSLSPVPFESTQMCPKSPPISPRNGSFPSLTNPLSQTINTLYQSLSSLVKDFDSCCITSIELGVSILLEDAFHDSIHTQHREFAELFFATQMFSQYKDQRLLLLDQTKKQVSPQSKGSNGKIDMNKLLGRDESTDSYTSSSQYSSTYSTPSKSTSSAPVSSESTLSLYSSKFRLHQSNSLVTSVPQSANDTSLYSPSPLKETKTIVTNEGIVESDEDSENSGEVVIHKKPK